MISEANACICIGDYLQHSMIELWDCGPFDPREHAEHIQTHQSVARSVCLYIEEDSVYEEVYRSNSINYCISRFD